MSQLPLFLFLMITGTFCFGLYDVAKKKLLNSGWDPIFLLGTVWAGAGILIFALSLAIGAPGPRPGFWQAAAITFSAGLSSQILVYLSFAREDASLMSPLRLITPPIVLLTGFMFLREKPSLLGAIGVFTTFFGLWQLLAGEASFRKVSFRSMLGNKGVLLGLAGSIIVGFSFPFDKKAILYSSSLFYSWWMFISIGVSSLLLAYLLKRKTGRLTGSIRNFSTMLGLIILFALGGWLTYEALKYSSVAYAANMKRLWPLWTVILSGEFLKEGNIKQKVISVLIMLGGIALTVFWG